MLHEKILVVATNTLFPDPNDQGFLKGNFDYYARHISQNGTFIDRAAAEVDPTHKQIIPYLIFMHQGDVFMMQRKSTSSEQRLKNKLTLGIGGHIREEDFILGPSIAAWAQREFHEEVNFRGSVTIKPLGIINVNTTPVDQVHAGFVYIIEGNSRHISIRSELKSGQMVPISECVRRYEEFERWSQLVIDQLTAHAHAL
jgi:predicted NUDIX family phosphoesterase